MSKEQIIAQIQQHEDQLRHLGLRSLVLVGSQARDQANPESDVDLLYEFEDGQATLDHLMDLRALLEDLLERPIDLIPARHLSPTLARYLGPARNPILEAA